MANEKDKRKRAMNSKALYIGGEKSEMFMGFQ